MSSVCDTRSKQENVLCPGPDGSDECGGQTCCTVTQAAPHAQESTESQLHFNSKCIPHLSLPSHKTQALQGFFLLDQNALSGLPPSPDSTGARPQMRWTVSLSVCLMESQHIVVSEPTEA